MRKGLIKYLLLLCVLLLSVYGQVYAGTAQEANSHIPIASLQGVNYTHHSNVQNEQDLAIKSSSSGSGINLKLEVTDISEEENHIVPSVQFLETFDNFSAFFYALLFGYLFQNLRGTFRIGEYTPYFSSFSPLYLAFRVIRL